MSGNANQDRTRERITVKQELATQRARMVEASATLQESKNKRMAYLAKTKHRFQLEAATKEELVADLMASLISVVSAVQVGLTLDDVFGSHGPASRPPA